MKNLKNKFILASAILALASCADNSYLGEQEEKTNTGGGAISFGYELPSVTRAEETDGAAATKLGNQFIVWGEKNEGSTDPAPAIVFKNYQVNYVASSANSSTSNTKGWEYVGYTHSANYQNNIKTFDGSSTTTALTTAQTIKYWDYNATSYTFTAVSASSSDIEGGKVIITKNTSGDVYAKGYTINVKSGASYDKIYFADRLRVTNTPSADYGKEVKLKFRNFTSKIRFGIYETIPGYKVKITKVYYNNNSGSTTNFGVDGSFITQGDDTKFTATYESSGDNTDRVKVAVDGSSSTQGYFETTPNSTANPVVSVPILTSDTYLGTDASLATFNKKEGDDTKAYTAILPNPSNNTNLTLKIEYQLTSEDTGETINVSAKEVQVPAAYCKWQSNYAYSYLFKITDKELTPITFDAVTITDETGNQETITTVPENVTQPSITTYSKASAVTTNNEYKKDNDIYVTVKEGSDNPTLTTTGETPNAKLYTVTLTAGTGAGANAAQSITEASVAKALTGTENPTGTWAVTDANGWVLTVTKTTGLSPVNTIPATATSTGVAITINGATFNPTTAGHYVFEYDRPDTYVVKDMTNVTSTSGLYVSDGNNGYTEASGDVDANTTYYEKKPAVKAYKVIKVVD